MLLPEFRVSPPAVVCIVEAPPFPNVTVPPLAPRPRVDAPENAVTAVGVVLNNESELAFVFIVGALRESIPPVPLFGERVMFPVELPPRVNVFLLRDCTLPAPSTIPFAVPPTADNEAVGLVVARPRTANFALVVACPPRIKSLDELTGVKAFPSVLVVQ